MHPLTDPESLTLEPRAKSYLSNPCRATPGGETLQKLAARAESEGYRTWILPCSVSEEGIWAGLKTWLLDLIPTWEAEAIDLIHLHDFELTSVLPALRTRLKVHRLSLTDTSAPEETVRNYAIDRAYRIGQGLVDLLDEWHTRAGGAPWMVICDDFDCIGALVCRFFGNWYADAPRNLDSI